MSEETVYSDSNVNVTTARVIIGATTYALRNITSVKSTYTPPSKGCAIALLIVGAFFLVGAFLMFQDGIVTGVMGLMFAAALLVPGILWLRSCKNTYHITIATSAGEHRALNSKDEVYIDKIVESINDAIARQQ